MAPNKSIAAIRVGVTAGVILAFVNFLYIVLPIIFYKDYRNLPAMVDTIVFALLTFGLYKKSRICAVLLISLYALENILKIFLFGTTYQTSNSKLFFTLFIAYGFVRGTMGTFSYHKELNSVKEVENSQEEV
ncbi:MAG TPA: hypothetical protein VF941_14225 [Clostridia bacterium]